MHLIVKGKFNTGSVQFYIRDRRCRRTAHDQVQGFYMEMTIRDRYFRTVFIQGPDKILKVNMTQRGCRKSPYGDGAFQEMLTGGNEIEDSGCLETQGVGHGKKPYDDSKDNPKRILDLPFMAGPKFVSIHDQRRYLTAFFMSGEPKT